MKKALLIYFFTIICGVCMAKPKIISSEPCEYREVLCNREHYYNFIKNEITFNQALEDIDMFIYLLENAYSGYDDLKSNNFKIQTLRENIPFTKGNNVKTDEILSFLYEQLKPYINDFHFYMIGKNKQLGFRYPIRVFFSNIFLLKNNEQFKVIKTDNPNIKIGDIYNDSTYYLFLYPSEGKDIYRLGVFLQKEDEKDNNLIELLFNDKKIYVSCSETNSQLKKISETSYKEIITNESVYFYLPTLIEPDIHWDNFDVYEEMYKKFTTLGLRYGEKKNYILDFRGNGGGNDLYCQKFLANLLFGKNEKDEIRNYKKFENHISFSSVNLYSPPILQAIKWYGNNRKKEYDNYFKKIYKFMKKNNFNKIKTENSKRGVTKKINFSSKLIVIMDKNSCSSGESFVYLANPLLEEEKNLFYIGENSGGCFNYGNVFCYQLPNSGMAIYLPSMKMKSGIIEECKGYMPNYWAFHEDLLLAIENITGDKQLSEKLKDINNNL